MSGEYELTFSGQPRRLSLAVIRRTTRI